MDEVGRHAGAVEDCVTEIVAAYVSNNQITSGALPALIASVQASLARMASSGQDVTAEAPVRATPAQIRKSITPDALISFLDGKSYKVLRRHLAVHGFTPASYRERFGLPANYPMVASSYSQQRTALAHSLEFGKQRRGRATNHL